MSLAKRKSNRERRRDAEAAIKTGTQSWMVLIAALADHGGTLTVTSATIDRVGSQLSRYDYCIRTGKVPGTFDLTLMDLHAEPTDTDHGTDQPAGEETPTPGVGSDPDGAPLGAATCPAHEVTVRRITDGDGN